jgi:hypothetical protein
MSIALNSRRPAFLCALLLLVCALATFPVAEIGMTDDWSYVQSARVLAQTGHIAYNGWTTAMLGWQLFLGALFVKLFGPSFTALRASTLLVAVVTALLMERTFRRAGIGSRNAAIGTLTLVLSPIFLPYAVSFMTEIAGLFCVVLCLYACLHALQAKTGRATLAWLAFAALSNAVGGTARQIAWLGVLVMFPCAVWLLRRRPHVLFCGAVLYIVSLAAIFGSLHWFHQQPYSAPPEPLFNALPNGHQLRLVGVEMLSLFLSGALLLLPVLSALAAKVRFRDPRIAISLLSGAALWIAACFALHHHSPGILDMLIAPFRGDCVTPFGLAATFEIQGIPPLVLPLGVRIVITVAVLFALACFFIFLAGNCRSSRNPAATQPTSAPISFNSLLVLLVPFTLAYLLLLLPRGILGFSFDRYLLPLFPIALILLLRVYEERAQPHLPWFSKALVLLFALYAVAGTHDAFSKYRAWAAAVDELRAAGVPDTAIDGGFEHNAMVQIETSGSILNLLGLPNAAEDLGPSSAFPADCQPTWPMLTPAIVPGYALSFDSKSCGGISRFASVSYREWLLARSIPVYVVDTRKPASSQH